MNQASDNPPALTVLYDGSCPLCRRGVMELTYRIFCVSARGCSDGRRAEIDPGESGDWFQVGRHASHLHMMRSVKDDPRLRVYMCRPLHR
jgi:hypothetical protein